MTSREDESRCQLDEHISPSPETGGRRTGKESWSNGRPEGGWRGGVEGGPLEQIQQGEGEQPARLPSPCRLKSCEENKVYCLERGGKKHVKSIKAMEVNN